MKVQLTRASMLYHKTLNLLEVQQKLGHRAISSTIRYTHLVGFKSDEYYTATATTAADAEKLAQSGWDKWDIIEGVHIYRKRK